MFASPVFVATQSQVAVLIWNCQASFEKRYPARRGRNFKAKEGFFGNDGKAVCPATGSWIYEE
jgi:hypothetical protein